MRELQILVPAEAGSDFYFVAPPVNRLIEYLYDEARATTPQIITGYIQSLDALGKQLSRAIDGEDITVVRLALEEIQQTLRRIQADLDETHRSILNEVAKYKTERQSITVRDKFRRIVHWMDRYVDPLVEIVSELEALPDHEGALRKNWEHQLTDMRGSCAAVLRDLDEVKKAVTNLNRAFKGVQVSNLTAIYMDVIELTDLVGSLRKLANVEQPGLFDDSTGLETVLTSFQKKFENKPVGAAAATAAHGVFSFLLAKDCPYELRGQCALVESPAVFMAAEQLNLNVGLMIYGHGRVSNREIDWLARSTDSDFSLLHLPDYDPVGLSEFQRLYSRFGERVALHLPADLEARFAKFSNPELLKKGNSQAMLAQLRRSNLPEVRRVVELIDRYNAGLEQEALLA